jgi:hypothetical protein
MLRSIGLFGQGRNPPTTIVKTGIIPFLFSSEEKEEIKAPHKKTAPQNQKVKYLDGTETQKSFPDEWLLMYAEYPEAYAG